MTANIKFVDDLSFHQYLKDKIREFNHRHWDEKVKHPFALECLDDQGEVEAGACGTTFGHWLMLDILWVEQHARGKGLGSSLLSQVEEIGKSRGCKFCLLDTLEFQAKGFYEKHGYELQWTQQHYPLNGAKYFMVKKLNCNDAN